MSDIPSLVNLMTFVYNDDIANLDLYVYNLHIIFNLH